MDYMDDAYIYLAVVNIPDIYVFMGNNMDDADIFIPDIYYNNAANNIPNMDIFIPKLSLINEWINGIKKYDNCYKDKVV